MGYACPVCGDPQQDAGHLANHLAFTAMLGEDDHEAWLDEHAPGWAESGEAALAERVVEHADERPFPQVFEDTTDGAGRAGRRDRPSRSEGKDSPDDEATREILAEARDLTERMAGGADADGDEDDADEDESGGVDAGNDDGGES